MKKYKFKSVEVDVIEVTEVSEFMINKIKSVFTPNEIFIDEDGYIEIDSQWNAYKGYFVINDPVMGIEVYTPEGFKEKFEEI